MKTTTINVPLGNIEISVALKASPRAKRLGLKLDAYTNNAVVTIPPGVSLAQAQSFLSNHHQWLLNKINHRGKKVAFESGNTIPVLGQPLTISYSQEDQPSVKVGLEEIIVKGFDPVVVPGLIKDWLRRIAYEKISHHSQIFAQQIDQKVKGITLKEMKSRWGSCSSSGNLSYNWRLVMAPYESLQYVCAHEVAHILEMNHSPRFWSTVEKIYPEYQIHRRWLKKNGSQLFLYG